MARTIKTFSPPKGKGGRPPSYPWEKWFNGKTWELHAEQDFHCQPTVMQNLARRTALKMEKAISVYRKSDTVLVITPRINRAAG